MMQRRRRGARAKAECRRERAPRASHASGAGPWGPRERAGEGVRGTKSADEKRSEAMSATTRREFFRKTATDTALAALLTAGATRVSASPLGLPIGSQTYPHRDRIVKGDFAGLLKDMKGL